MPLLRSSLFSCVFIYFSQLLQFCVLVFIRSFSLLMNSETTLAFKSFSVSYSVAFTHFMLYIFAQWFYTGTESRLLQCSLSLDRQLACYLYVGLLQIAYLLF